MMITPRERGQPGVVLELKAAPSNVSTDMDTLLDAALKQIESRDYVRALEERGAARHPQLHAKRR